MRGALLGCPSMQEQLAWPPVAGDYSQGISTNARPWEGGRPAPVAAGKMQVWVQQTDALVTIRSRSANVMSVRSSLPYQWRSTEEYGMAQFSCKSDILHFEEVELPVERKDSAGTRVRRAFALARLKDAGIAAGIKTTVTGRTGSVFGRGGQSSGSYNMANLVHWSWSKLARLDPVNK